MSENVPISQSHVRPIIAAHNVTKIYKMGDQEILALDNVSVEIQSGDFIAIMGSSGSGKSTMMNLIGCLDKPTSGSLEIDGQDITTLSSDKLASLRSDMIGFVFQQFNLLPRTPAYRQVMLPLLYARPRPADLEAEAKWRLKQVGLEMRMDHLPRQLSGGQQQRVAIARALVNHPHILLADEPTGALDSKTSEEIMRLFVEINSKGITVVVVTHETDIAHWANRRITFRDGRIISDERQVPYRSEAAE